MGLSGAWNLWRRALCLMFGHQIPSQRGWQPRESHLPCRCCGRLVRAPMEPVD